MDCSVSLAAEVYYGVLLCEFGRRGLLRSVYNSVSLAVEVYYDVQLCELGRRGLLRCKAV